MTLAQRIEQLALEVERLKKVNEVLMTRVERSMESSGDSYSLFETNILLQKTVDERTDKLKAEVQERMRAEARLRASNRRLLLHIQQTPLGVIEWDLDFRVVEWNKAAEKIFGFTRDEAMSKRAADLILPRAITPFIEKAFQRLVTQKGSVRGSNANVCKDGRIVSCDWYNTALVDDEGRVVGVASLVQDITERFSREREEKERLDRAHRQRVAIGRMTADEVITTGDFERATKTILEKVSEAMGVERVGLWLFNTDRTELTCFDLYTASTDEHTSGTVRRRVDCPNYFKTIIHDRMICCGDIEAHARSCEFRKCRLLPEGVTSKLDVALKVSGDFVGVYSIEHTGAKREWATDEVAFADEISSLISQVYLNAQRKRSEEQKSELQARLERAERMESLGILAGGVAHDLNNILGPLVGFSELILRELDNKDKTADRVKIIGQSAQQAADVIQDLLTLARRGRYNVEPVDINQVVRDFIESPAFLSLTEQRPEIEVAIELDDSIGKLQGSSSNLSKVVMNLVLNAFDAIQDSGKVVVSTSSRDVRELSNGFNLGDSSGRYLLLRIKDTGVGIAPEHLGKIFEPYFSKKKLGRSSGSGLGLSVVYGVIKDHHGFYDIQSSPGEGTDFTVFLPEADVLMGEVKIDRGDIKGDESILIVDDNAGQREVAEELIKSLGYTVVTAASGEDAVEFLNTHSVDLVLLDMIMDPGMDGLDTYREIIKLHPGQKAIIASGFSATDRVEQMQKLGAGPYIRKPYSLTIMGQAIRLELDKVKVAVGS